MIKKIILILVLNLASTFIILAQSVEDIFDSKDYTITWLGIDYSHTKIVGPVRLFGGKTLVTAETIRDRYYVEWNQLILDEPDKFNIASILYRTNVEKDIRMVKLLNAAADIDSIEVTTTTYFNKQEIEKIVSAYPIENKTGIGMVFIAECLNKSNAEAYYHVVFFNMQTKEILLQDRIRGAADGAGIKNYWAGSYFNVMYYIKDIGYRKWKGRYSKSAPNSQKPAAPKW